MTESEIKLLKRKATIYDKIEVYATTLYYGGLKIRLSGKVMCLAEAVDKSEEQLLKLEAARK